MRLKSILSNQLMTSLMWNSKTFRMSKGHMRRCRYRIRRIWILSRSSMKSSKSCPRTIRGWGRRIAKLRMSFMKQDSNNLLRSPTCKEKLKTLNLSTTSMFSLWKKSTVANFKNSKYHRAVKRTLTSTNTRKSLQTCKLLLKWRMKNKKKWKSTFML